MVSYHRPFKMPDPCTSSLILALFESGWIKVILDLLKSVIWQLRWNFIQSMSLTQGGRILHDLRPKYWMIKFKVVIHARVLVVSQLKLNSLVVLDTRGIWSMPIWHIFCFTEWILTCWADDTPLYQGQLWISLTWVTIRTLQAWQN